MFMKHYAPNRCEPSIEALNFGVQKKNYFFFGGGGGVVKQIEVFVKIQKKNWGGGDRGQEIYDNGLSPLLKQNVYSKFIFGHKNVNFWPVFKIFAGPVATIKLRSRCWIENIFPAFQQSKILAKNSLSEVSFYTLVSLSSVFHENWPWLGLTTVKFLNFWMPENCSYLPKIQTKRPNLRIFRHKDANRMTNSKDPDQTATLIWVCTFCPDLSVRILRVITVFNEIWPWG